MICPKPMSLPRPNGRGSRDRIVVPCGKCPACLANRRDEWITRLVEEAKDHDKMIFLTLTYEDNNLTYGETSPTLVKSDVQKFLKRFRKKIGRKIRYYCVGEYGTSTYRPHYHFIMFNVDDTDYDSLLSSWGLGHIEIGSVTIRSISYVCKFHVNKSSAPRGTMPSFTLMSTKPAIGASYVTRMADYHSASVDRAYYSDYNIKKHLPRYFKNKLYSKEEREEIALRYVDSTYDASVVDSKPDYFRDRYYRIKAYEAKFKSKSNFNNKL